MSRDELHELDLATLASLARKGLRDFPYDPASPVDRAALGGIAGRLIRAGVLGAHGEEKRVYITRLGEREIEAYERRVGRSR